MNRRSLILGLTGALAAPAVVRAESLMKIWVPPVSRFVTVRYVECANEGISYLYKQLLLERYAAGIRAWVEQRDFELMYGGITDGSMANAGLQTVVWRMANDRHSERR